MEPAGPRLTPVETYDWRCTLFVAGCPTSLKLGLPTFVRAAEVEAAARVLGSRRSTCGRRRRDPPLAAAPSVPTPKKAQAVIHRHAERVHGVVPFDRSSPVVESVRPRRQ